MSGASCFKSSRLILVKNFHTKLEPPGFLLVELVSWARDNRHLNGVPPIFLGGTYPIFEFAAKKVGVKYPCIS